MKKNENILLTLVNIMFASTFVLSRFKWLLIIFVSLPFVYLLLYLFDVGFQVKEEVFNSDSYMTQVRVYVLSVICYATYREYLDLTSKGYIFKSIDSYVECGIISIKLIVNYISIAFARFLLFLLLASPAMVIVNLEILPTLQLLLIVLTYHVIFSLITLDTKDIDDSDIICLPDLRQNKS